jgi:8-oxo-dGTP diphosphatase
MGVQLFHVGIKALCKNEQGKYLVLQVNPKELKGDNPAYWDLPGGRIEEGDSVENTLKREIKEELGISFDGKSTFFTGVVSNIKIPTENGDVGLVLMIYEVEIDGNSHFTLSFEHIAYEWVDGKTAAQRLAFKYPKEFTDKLV